MPSTSVAPALCACSTARANAAASSGLGEVTLGNSPSGRLCFDTTDTCAKPKRFSKSGAKRVPAPWIGVYTTFNEARAERSSGVKSYPIRRLR